MVIGNGLIARSFKKYGTYDQFLIFASGVSNSKFSTRDDFARERDMFMQTVGAHRSKTMVYFSTTSINDPDLRETPYVMHKADMEELVKAEAAHFHIFRLSNVAGVSNNPNTILNFFFFHILQGQPFELWKYSERNIIDVEDVFHICDNILGNNLFPDQVINVANEKNYTALEIVRCIETFTNKKAIFTEKEKGASFNIDLTAVRPVYQSLGIEFGSDYLAAILQKYYHDK